MAGDIDKTKARQVAAYFMASQFGNKAITPQSLDQVYEFRNTVRDIATLYVFNTADKRGFVIVAGSDWSDPIVAYMGAKDMQAAIDRLKTQMIEAAKRMDFLVAAQYRDEILKLEELLKSKEKA